MHGSLFFLICISYLCENQHNVMVKSDIFWAICEKAAETFKVSLDGIMRDMRDKDCTDARCVLVQYARRVGYSAKDIAGYVLEYCDEQYDKDILNRKARTVNNIYCSYMTRCNHDKLFCLLSVDVKKWLKETYGVGEDY